MNRGRNGMFPEGRLEGHDLSSNGGGEVMQRRPKWIKLRPVVKKKTKKQKTVLSQAGTVEVLDSELVKTQGLLSWRDRSL